MRAQIKQLKSEKMRMMKRMKDEAERVREITERNQREIQSLRRKEKAAQEQKNDEDRKESRRSSDDFSPIYEVFASEREKIITSEIGNELGGDAQALDDKIEMITSEIAYINAKIHSLQSSIAGEYSKESEDKSRKNSIKSSKIERNFDEYESYTILESFFKEIVDSRTGDWSRRMTLEQQEKTIMDLRKTLLAMRRAAVLTTSEYEKKNRELEEALRLGGRSPSPSTLEKRELQMDDIENSTFNAISLFDHKLDQAYAEVEAAVSAGTLGTSAYFSSLLSASPMNTGNNSANFLRPPIPPAWLNLQPRENVLEQTNETTPDVPTNPRRKDSGNSESSGDNNNNVKRRISNGRRLKRPSDGPSTPSTLSTSSTPKDENISPLERTRSLNSQPLERTRSLNSQPLERTRSIGQPLERTRSSDQHLKRARAGVQLSSSRRSSLRDGSTILAHNRQSSSISMGFHLESGGDGFT
ncbi:hypothetical protein RhiirA5_399827 [Rhizophagus irregularis]|uniref:Uncharacterized protein n=2 Tax=Rhizophagus irregularis TaxID=588596 RepID=A0A2N0PKW6_9GLOM|nr:hypothetical protein RhiirA5_399827 [Rhizophagus irregularis]